MTIHRDPDEILAAWLDEGPSRLPEQTRRAISVALPTTSQRRRGWSAPWRPSTMSTTLKYAIGGVAIVAIAFGGWFFLAPAPGGVGAVPSPTPSSTVSPAAPTPSAAGTASAYDSTLFGIPFSLTLPAGWSVGERESGLIALSGPDQGAAIMNISKMTVRGPTAGTWVPWPADIHAWLSSRPEFKPGVSRPVTVAGHAGIAIDVDVVTPLADTGDWVQYGPTGTGSGFNLRAANDTGVKFRLVVIPTGSGTGIVAYIDSAPADFAQNAASLDQLLSTLTFR